MNVYKLMLRVCHSPQAAEDLTQETMIRAFRSFKQYDPERPLMPWLYRIAMNAFKESYRNKAAKGEQFSVPIDATYTDSEDSYGQTDLRLTINEALLRLTDRQREILVRWAEGASYVEIAHSLGCTEGNVRSHFHTAARRLSKVLP